MKTENLNGEQDVRWRRRKDARPNEILGAALECFAESGFAATRLDEIARRAGVTKGTLYLYFTSKEEIFKSVVREEIIANITSAEEFAADDSHSSTEVLEHFFRYWVRTILTTKVGALPKLVLSEGRNFPELAKFYYDEVIERGFRLLGGALRRGVSNGEFVPIDVEYAIKSMISPAIFALLWKHSFEPHGGGLDVEKLLDTHIKLIVNGLKRNDRQL